MPTMLVFFGCEERTRAKHLDICGGLHEGNALFLSNGQKRVNSEALRELGPNKVSACESQKRTVAKQQLSQKPSINQPTFRLGKWDTWTVVSKAFAKCFTPWTEAGSNLQCKLVTTPSQISLHGTPTRSMYWSSSPRLMIPVTIPEVLHRQR